MDALKEDLTKQDDIYAHMSKEERLMKQEELSFYSSSTNDQGDDNIWGLLSGVGGNIYEWCVLPRVFAMATWKRMMISFIR